MRLSRTLLVLVLAAAGCGDNHVPPSATGNTSGGFSSVGGSQVSHSKSFMLVTNVSNVNQPISKNSTVTLKPGLAAR
jgi:hypothetical protein